jgi:hypothetical protein
MMMTTTTMMMVMMMMMMMIVVDDDDDDDDDDRPRQVRHAFFSVMIFSYVGSSFFFCLLGLHMHRKVKMERSQQVRTLLWCTKSVASPPPLTTSRAPQTPLVTCKSEVRRLHPHPPFPVHPSQTPFEIIVRVAVT